MTGYVGFTVPRVTVSETCTGMTSSAGSGPMPLVGDMLCVPSRSG